MDFDTHPDILPEIYHALRSPRRCYVLKIMAQSQEEIINIRTLAEQIAGIEEDVPPGKVSGEPYRNVYNALAQTHLSTLSDAGLIIYESDRKLIRRGPRFQLGVLVLTLNSATYQTLQDQ